MSTANGADRLSSLLAATDGGLTRLDVEELLIAMLERLREILGVDTAAILLIEPGSGELVARAASGLEEEVRQGVRIPVGTGFAGRVAATRQPVLLDRVDSTTVSNRILWEKGIRTMLGVPLLNAEGVIGVLHVGRLVPEPFDEHDAALLQVAAERISAALERRRLAVEAAAASLLERGLLPTRLPQLPGISFAARYAPADDRAIGGDWYDAFTLPDGALWIVVGDVAGHGLNAAVVMGRVKSALRAYALLGEAPHRVLEMTDRKVDHFEVGTMVTVVCAVSRAPYTEWQISSAGHPPPVLARPDSEPVLLDMATCPPLGAVADATRTSSLVPVPAGSVLVFYTDGLIERRDEAMTAGLERLRRATHVRDAEAVCTEVMHHLVGDSTTLDDIAMLVVRTAPSPVVADGTSGELHLAAEVTLPPHVEAIGRARRLALDAAGSLGADGRQVLQLLVSELATNCVRHARTEFTVRVLRSDDEVRVEVADLSASPVETRRAGPFDVHGRGIALVQGLADDHGVAVAPGGQGKTVWFSLATDRSGTASLALARRWRNGGDGDR